MVASCLTGQGGPCLSRTHGPALSSGPADQPPTNPLPSGRSHAAPLLSLLPAGEGAAARVGDISEGGEEQDGGAARSPASLRAGGGCGTHG